MLKAIIHTLSEKNDIFRDCYFLLSEVKQRLFSCIPDVIYLKYMYRKNFNTKLNLNNPKSFNEKLQWLKLYNRKEEYTMMVDKHLVKQYVSDIIGNDYIIPTLKVWTKVKDVNLDELPNEFVIKCNHNSGVGMLICKDKSEVDLAKLKKELNRGMHNNYYLSGREWPYKNVKRVIIAEKLMKSKDGGPLQDYKVLCFNGVPKLIELHKGRFTDEYTQDFYDVHWNKTNISQVGESVSTVMEKKPLVLDEMLKLSSILAKGIPHVRVDWYIIDGHLYFGEMTFFDASGFDSFDDYNDDLLLGSWINLPDRT